MYFNMNEYKSMYLYVYMNVNMYEHVYKIGLLFKSTQKFQEALSSTCHGIVYILTKKEIVTYIQIYIHTHTYAYVHGGNQQQICTSMW